MKITAIGNPPAFAIESGILLIPNKESFNFPLSGSFGKNNFYKYGIVVIAIGFVILILRKRLLITKQRKAKKRGRH